MKILVIDNYDSFTYNLVQLLGKEVSKIIVKRNDEINIEEISLLKPDKILISPGPGRPEHSNVSLACIKKFAGKIPILGVCLGMQAIGFNYSCKIINAPELMHGKTSLINHDNKSIFKNVQQKFTATRYHSLIIDSSTLPEELIISASTDDDVVMGVRHSELPLEGIQFHPESILTKEGKYIIENWIEQ
ncbi:MAG: aminodeoxychorismate/anthranilate synthase component II [Ignavibacteria bacterium]|jgi:anthranilate synthase/aminodeoxychorismate synthase-like glutamine amidotransferase